MQTASVTANGVRFATVEAGSGPLVLLLHGFPDTARTFEPLMAPLAAAGFRAVAPFMRGYPPTETPSGAFFDTATLTADAAALAESLSPDEPAFVIGHDWGAFATYGLAAARPELLRAAVTMAIPHPAVSATFMASEEQLKRMWYVWLFQTPGIADALGPAFGFDIVRTLWRDWSPGHDDTEHIEHVIETLSQPGAWEAALSYYRALFDPDRGDPSHAALRSQITGDARVPVHLIYGERDGCIGAEFAEPSKPHLGPEGSVTVLNGCGHFLHRERPDDVAALVLERLAQG